MALATEQAEALDDDVSEQHRIADARVGKLVASTYRITRHLGSGGSGHVFEAEHVRLGKAFAIKLLRAGRDTSQRATQRFRREAKAQARLKSEHIVSVVDCGELDDQTPYIVMELLEGEDLRALLEREGSLPARRAVHLVSEACRGLMVVHEAGLVHRDLKPENLFLAKRATGEDWCKVLDFGVAKMDASLSTAQGAIVGTVRYMAPEQLSDGDSVAAATDIYALGAILYECLAGKPLHDAATVQEMMYQVMNETPTPLATLRPSLPRHLVDAVQRAIEKDARRRPQSASDFLELLLPRRPSTRAQPSDETLPEDSRVNEAVALERGTPTGKLAWAVALLLAVAGGIALGQLNRATLAAASPVTPAPQNAVHTSTPPSSISTSTVSVASAAPSAVGSAPVASASAGPARASLANAPQVSRRTTMPAKPDPAAVKGFDVVNPYGE